MQFQAHSLTVRVKNEEIDLVAEPSDFDMGGVIALTKLS